MAVVALFSCKKNNDTVDTIPPVTVNWKQQLKNTIWAGEFSYSTGAYTGLQPFSIEMNNDGTLTWTDVASTRPGGSWTIEDNLVTVVFPNGTKVSAKVSADSWINFTNPPVNGFRIENLSRSDRPDRTVLTNTSWIGKQGGYNAGIQFTTDGNIRFDHDVMLSYSGGYTIAGAGILFKKTYPDGDLTYYGIVQKNNTEIKGFKVERHAAKTTYLPWNAGKN